MLLRIHLNRLFIFRRFHMLSLTSVCERSQTQANMLSKSKVVLTSLKWVVAMYVAQ